MGWHKLRAVWSSWPPLGTLDGGLGSPHVRLQGWAGGPMGRPPLPSVSSRVPWEGPGRLCPLSYAGEDGPGGALRCRPRGHRTSQQGHKQGPRQHPWSRSRHKEMRHGGPAAVRARGQRVLRTLESAVSWARPALWACSRAEQSFVGRSVSVRLGVCSPGPARPDRPGGRVHWALPVLTGAQAQWPGSLGTCSWVCAGSVSGSPPPSSPHRNSGHCLQAAFGT